MDLRRKQPDYTQFIKAVKREGKPDHLPFYEHYASPEFIAERMNVPMEKIDPDLPGYWQLYVDFWLGMGYDVVPIEVLLNCPRREGHDAEASEGSEGYAMIQSWEDFEKYPWPSEERPLNFEYFEVASKCLPEGAKLVAGVGMGPYEWVSQLMGVMGLSYALVDQPDLVEAMFDKIKKLIISVDTQLAQMDSVCALRQGDDLGFKTSTFLKPDLLRQYIFPTYKAITELAHAQGKPFILHSCGNLSEVYEDLIEYCKIDAKHSFEDAIMPVSEFKKKYGDRITPLGGLDVDVICRAEPDKLRAYTRKHIEDCFYDGYWALGTGNSLTEYMPVDNYLIVLEEAIRVTS